MKNKPSKPNQPAVPDKAAIKKAKTKENRERSKESMLQKRWPPFKGSLPGRSSDASPMTLASPVGAASQ